ncbi:tyrosine-type recombinase/integrase [Crenobacter sp. SG2305]|uniref:tyrosine-type recombinase/integrase n=1 Tax=Crenobacter oryzisoli TaxID=3056844 RepID=UPI0025AA3392|nr:tyrosine-type recombinase/integrase [Crenobacter sp. SG2305]MDN0082372.1 tyrosine-type recombinase/integrase [Crenobacter sp. SG2305]
MQGPTLFDCSYRYWLSDPETSFDAWLSRQDYKKDTMAIYRWMWQKFCRWLAQHRYRLDTLQADQLAQFVKEEALLKRHGYRYVRLIERVYQHLLSLPDAPAGRLNPASKAAQQGAATGRNDPTGFFSAAERDRLARLIETGKLTEEKEEEKKTRRGVNPAQQAWRRDRDLALLGVFLGGGLKVHEAEGLTVSCIVGGDRLQLPFSPKTRGAGREGDTGAGQFARAVPLEPFAVVALRRWLARRGPCGGAEPLFPASEQGRPLDASNVFRRVRTLLDEAGVADQEAARACCQTLRNAYAATLLERAVPDDEIVARMGWSDVSIVGRLRFAYEAWLARQSGAPLP